MVLVMLVVVIMVMMLFSSHIFRYVSPDVAEVRFDGQFIAILRQDLSNERPAFEFITPKNSVKQRFRQNFSSGRSSSNCFALKFSDRIKLKDLAGSLGNISTETVIVMMLRFMVLTVSHNSHVLIRRRGRSCPNH